MTSFSLICSIKFVEEDLGHAFVLTLRFVRMKLEDHVFHLRFTVSFSKTIDRQQYQLFLFVARVSIGRVVPRQTVPIRFVEVASEIV